MTTSTVLGAIDAPRAAGIIALGAIVLLAVLRKGFGGVSLKLGD
jgi:hypothetical protein